MRSWFALRIQCKMHLNAHHCCVCVCARPQYSAEHMLFHACVCPAQKYYYAIRPKYVICAACIFFISKFRIVIHSVITVCVRKKNK